MFTTVFWVVAGVASAFLGRFAVSIFDAKPPGPVVEPPKLDSKLAPWEREGVRWEWLKAHPAWPWFVFQFWVNALGALTGWFALWLMVRGMLRCIEKECQVELTVHSALLSVVAFVGITGFLPTAMVYGLTGLMNALGFLGGKRGE